MTKPLGWVAMLLILIGAVASYMGLTATRRSSILQVGSLDMRVTRKEVDPITTFAGVAAIAGGIVLLVRATRQG